jgi:hypothetical protein
MATIRNILKENGFAPGSDRSEGTWSEFLKREAATLWACDYFSTKVWPLLGPIQFFVLFFIHVGSRRVHIAGMSTNPNPAWSAQQARNVAMFLAEQPEKPTVLLRDHDSNFGSAFDAVFETEGIEVKKVGPRAPNMNAFADGRLMFGTLFVTPGVAASSLTGVGRQLAQMVVPLAIWLCFALRFERRRRLAMRSMKLAAM